MWYKLTLAPDDNDTLLVTAPSFPEVTTFAEDEGAAARCGRDAIEEAIAARIADGRGIPFPLRNRPAKGSSVEVPGIVFLKSALYMQMRAKGWTRADLTRALGVKREHVDTLFRLEHNSRLNSLEDAFKALGSSLRFDVPFADAA